MPITGIGAVTPLGVGADTLHERWVAGQSGIADRFGRCDEFDPLETLTRKQARACDRYSQLAMAASDEALAQAGWSEELPYPAERIGCVVATAAGGIETYEAQINDVNARGGALDRVSPLTITKFMPNAAASMVAQRHGLRGECVGLAAACASGGQAVAAAMRLLRAGDVDAVLVAATDAPLTPTMTSVLDAMGATSPSGNSRPFDRDRDGFVAAEGAAAVILETEEGARARGADPVARVLGYGTTCDAFHISAPEPTSATAARAIELALADSGLTPDDLDYVNCHGTATKLNDVTETQAIKLALGERAEQVPASSLKSAIGHLIGAAGLVEAVATIQAIRHGVAPPTLNLENPDEDMTLDYVPLVARPLEPPRSGQWTAISNSFGFGGHNAVIALQATHSDRT